MDFLINDLSLHGQYPDIRAFRTSVNTLMTIRELIVRKGYQFYSHRNLKSKKVTSEFYLQEALRAFSVDEKRAFILFLQKNGPFWEDSQHHAPDDLLESEGIDVANSAIGEAACRTFDHGTCSIASLIPSLWEKSPLTVSWLRSGETVDQIEVLNLYCLHEAERLLASLETQPKSWQELEKYCMKHFSNLCFLENAFEPMKGLPFVPSASKRIIELLQVLEKIKTCYDKHGNRTREGHELYETFFTGKNALFSGESSTNEGTFEDELKFRLPNSSGAKISCPWHGKIRSPQLRIHFTTPISANKPLYLVYIGPKITKK